MPSHADRDGWVNSCQQIYKDKQTNRQTDKQTNKQTNRQTDKTHSQTCTYIEKNRRAQIVLTDKHSNIQSDIQTDKIKKD